MNDGPEMLAADRHRLLREHLMSEIARESAAKAPRPRRRLGWIAVPPLVVGLAAAVALVASGSHPRTDLAPAGPVGSRGPALSAVPAPTGGPSHRVPSLPPCSTVSASPAASSATPASGDPRQALAAAARTAAAMPAPTVKDSQFMYTETLQQFGTDKPCVRQEWIAADGKSEGLIIDPRNGEMGFSPTNPPGRPASLTAPDYQYLASLPTDPQQLLQRIYAERSKKGNEPNGAAFRTIENLLSYQLVPPAVGGAFCQAAAAIPGAEVAPDAVDLMGRHGIGVIRSDSVGQMELIFDPGTCAFLGHRDVQTADNSAERGSAAGSIFSTAIVRQAVTDHVREQPQG